MPPQTPKKKGGAGRIIAVLVIVVVVIIAGAVALYVNQNNKVVTGGTPVTAPASPTKPATATKATTTAGSTSTGAVGTFTVSCSGSSIEADAFSAKVPSGWSCSKVTNGLMLSDKKFDTLMVEVISDGGDVTKACESISAAGTMTALPDTQWGGKTATTVSMANGNTKVHFRCATSNGIVYYLMAIPITGTYDEVVAGVDALTSAWTWK